MELVDYRVREAVITDFLASASQVTNRSGWLALTSSIDEIENAFLIWPTRLSDIQSELISSKGMCYWVELWLQKHDLSERGKRKNFLKSFHFKIL